MNLKDIEQTVTMATKSKLKPQKRLENFNRSKVKWYEP